MRSVCLGAPSGRKPPMEASTRNASEQVEQEIAELLDQEVFEPPEKFVERALISDESVHEEAARDP